VDAVEVADRQHGPARLAGEVVAAVNDPHRGS
jgi:hypothetical protein